MLTRWFEKWIETPRPDPVPGAVEIRVEATAPFFPFGAAHGREFGDPLRKVASFTVTDGPKATIRKARSKRAETAYTGDYHLTLILGTAGDRRVFALAPRAPSSAGWMLAPESLVRDAPEGPAEEVLRTAAMAAVEKVEAGDVRQSYLYSGMEPPPSLVEAMDAAASGRGAADPETTDEFFEFIRPPASAAGEVGQLMPLPVRGPARYAPPLVILGAGDYTRIEVVPALGDAALRRSLIADREPQIAALAAARLGFLGATTDPGGAIDVLPERGLVVVATAHDSHAALAALALDGGHRVFAEKPAIVTPSDLELLTAAAERNPGELEVGFNRRWNPLVERARRELASTPGPATIVATIREVDITPDHWYLWPNQGTRVAGNLCHWIDLSLHLMGPGPEPTEVSVSPRVSSEPTGIDAERTFSIAFDDGSSVTLLPTARGDSVRGVQEQIEIRRGPLTLRIDDLWSLHGLRSGRPIRRRTLWRDKGHARMYEAAMGRFERGEPAAYPLDDLRRVGAIQLAATELLQAGEAGGAVSDLVMAAKARESAP